ncbi:phosphatase PAP2 family protein [Bacillus sp. RG28]|uniref:Phosphatase PAP2 family protein n=1 Tax=Gottfriedia endophytica TaxID=2820819 RepID=A0A940NT81_9BACI|nr:phosphatase PAP2 family protein [Gottfriedia endophytica]MBP0724438.1 phosphatase PAP2 family protein [Gottfriedia endophytica]
MNLKLKLISIFLISLVCAIGFGWIAILVGEHHLVQFDSSIISFVQGFESPTLTSLFKFFTFIGSTPVVVVLCVLIIIYLYKVLHHRSEIILFIVVMGGSTVLNFVLKHLFHRARPTIHRLIQETGYSFPSGHSMEAFALYGVLAYLLWRHTSSSLGKTLLIIFSVFMTLMIGISRIYLGVHYPSDVIGAYLVSGFWLAGSIGVYEQYLDRRMKRSYI